MSLPPGSEIDSYRIVSPIGFGGFSTVYLAHDDRLDSAVAIKVLAENRALDADARRRFIEEAQWLRKVKSRSVVTVHDVGSTEHQQPYIVMEYADRGDLDERQRGLTTPVPAKGTLLVVHFLNDALSALHGVGLVHRDVKPHNILLRSASTGPDTGVELLAADEEMILGDLGFAKDLTMASGLTVGGGTWAYQAPEQRDPFGVIDARTDIYSATAVIASLCLGAVPDDALDWLDLIEQSDLNGETKSALQRGLSEDPDGRPDSIAEWTTLLVKALNSAPDAATTPATEVAHAEPSTSGGRMTLAVLGAVLVGLLGLFAGFALSNDDASNRVVSVDGVATTSINIGDEEVSISGPSDISIGQPVTFIADLPAGMVGTWINPDGSTGRAGDIEFTATTAGSFEVSLLVTAPEQDPVIVTHVAEVDPE